MPAPARWREVCDRAARSWGQCGPSQPGEIERFGGTFGEGPVGAAVEVGHLGGVGEDFVPLGLLGFRHWLQPVLRFAGFEKLGKLHQRILAGGTEGASSLGEGVRHFDGQGVRHERSVLTPCWMSNTFSSAGIVRV